MSDDDDDDDDGQAARRASYLHQWHDLGGEFARQKDLIIRRTRALANFVLSRSPHHAHHWVSAGEVVEVDGLGTRLQFHRHCYCGRRQALIEWWNQYKEPCYDG